MVDDPADAFSGSRRLCYKARASLARSRSIPYKTGSVMAQWCIGSFPDCSANYTTIQPDPDIDGIGVFSAFITTAGLSLIVMFAGTVIKHLPEKPEEKTGADNCQPSQSAAITSALQTNRTDPAEAITNVPRKGHTWIQVTEDTREYWLTIIEKLMLSISDQQLVTGITILATGFLKCDITAYHFSFVSDLAWLSSSAHMISLRFLDLYLRKYAAARIWRIFLMFCMYVLLMATLILENSSGWYGNLAFPAQCYFMDTTDSFITKGATALAFFFNTFLLTLGYARVLAPLILLSFAELRKWLLSKISSPVKSVMPPVVRLKTVGQDSTEHLSRSGTTLFSRARTWWNNDWVTCFFDSFWFGWGVYGMVSDRTSGAPYIPSGSLSAQSNWGFGQLVPVFLIFIPIFTAFEIFWGKSSLSKSSIQSLTVDAYCRANRRIHHSKEVKGGSER